MILRCLSRTFSGQATHWVQSDRVVLIVWMIPRLASAATNLQATEAALDAMRCLENINEKGAQ
jgi:hypothetical protein